MVDLRVIAGPRRASMPIRGCALIVGTLSLASLVHATHFRFGHVTWQPVGGSIDTAEFAVTVGVRRTGAAGPGPFTGLDGLPGVGDIVVERQGPSLFEYGDGSPIGGPMVLRVTSIDTVEDWMLGQALRFEPDPGTGATVVESEPNNTIATADPIVLGDDFAGQISPAGDNDVVSFSGVAGQHVRLRVVPGSLPTPVVGIFTSAGAYILDWFDEISLVLPTTDTYLVQVIDNGGAVGDYVLETRSGTFVENLRHTYPAPTNAGTPWLAGIDACCRLGQTQNAGSVPPTVGQNGSPYRVQTEVRFDVPNASPVSSLAPIVNVPVDTIYAFFVPAIDPDGDPIHWRFATNQEAGGGSYESIGPPNAPSAPTIDAPTGLVTWDTFGTTVGHLYTMQVAMEDVDVVSGALLGRSAIDFIIRIVESSGNAPPVCSIAPPGPFFVAPGQPISFVVSGTDPDPGSLLTLNSGGFPTGASFSPGLPTVGLDQVSSTFDWTPAPDQLGVFVVSLSVTDAGGLQSLCSVTITVEAPIVNQPPTCEISPVGNFAVTAGDTVAFTVTGSDPDAGDTLTLDATGVPAGATVVPGLPLVGNSPLATSFEWTPGDGDAGLHVIAFTVTDAAGESSECFVTITVAAAPGEGCVFSQGYWRNHPAAWPVETLTLGAVPYSKAQLLSILAQPVGGNGLVSLSRQLIATRLNIANGASTTSVVDAAIAAADALIGGLVVPPIGNGRLAPSATSGLNQVLDLFNNGLADGGPPHCE